MERNSQILIDISGPSKLFWHETAHCSTQENDQNLAALPVRRAGSADVMTIGGTLRRVPRPVFERAREGVRA